VRSSSPWLVKNLAGEGAPVDVFSGQRVTLRAEELGSLEVLFT
jgi:hypothetical protein